jgi:hypothetical protein
VVPAQAKADEPSVIRIAAHAMCPAERPTRPMPDAAEAKVARTADHDAPFLRPARRAARAAITAEAVRARCHAVEAKDLDHGAHSLRRARRAARATAPAEAVRARHHAAEARDLDNDARFLRPAHRAARATAPARAVRATKNAICSGLFLTPASRVALLKAEPSPMRGVPRV